MVDRPPLAMPIHMIEPRRPSAQEPDKHVHVWRVPVSGSHRPAAKTTGQATSEILGGGLPQWQPLVPMAGGLSLEPYSRIA